MYQEHTDFGLLLIHLKEELTVIDIRKDLIL